MTHICVSKRTIIGSDNGLSPGRRQAIIWTNAGILLIRTLGTKFSEILIKIITFSLKKMHLKVSPAKRRPFCLSLNVLMTFRKVYFPSAKTLMILLHSLNKHSLKRSILFLIPIWYAYHMKRYAYINIVLKLKHKQYYCRNWNVFFNIILVLRYVILGLLGKILTTKWDGIYTGRLWSIYIGDMMMFWETVVIDRNLCDKANPNASRPKAIVIEWSASAL